MASAAQRPARRDLEPHWREKLADSLRRFARRSLGAILVALGVGLGVALVTYSSVDPSLTTAAGGPPTNWLGAVGAYSSDLLLLLFGPAAALFLPLLILTGVRLLREVDGGRLGSRYARRACRGAAARHLGGACSPEPRSAACPAAGAASSASPPPMASTG